MACFANISVSQGSVATYTRCGGIFNIRLTTNSPRNLPVIFLKSIKIWQNYVIRLTANLPKKSSSKKIKSVKIWQNYGHESVTPLFCPPCRHDGFLAQSNVSKRAVRLYMAGTRFTKISYDFSQDYLNVLRFLVSYLIVSYLSSNASPLFTVLTILQVNRS